ncbi:S8 family peptidase [Vibrio nigripulchritudo]|uniref:S8 family peptidase n=1 Tax=Vibrio nigripulchritudo TaxID=28173 RepID=UPI00190A77C3|nr:S8 family peptidase [Vibrio nigripulchritudo]
MKKTLLLATAISLSANAELKSIDPDIAIEGSYIVVLKDGEQYHQSRHLFGFSPESVEDIAISLISDAQNSTSQAYSVKTHSQSPLKETYDVVLRGFHADLSTAEAKYISEQPNVKYVVPDIWMEATNRTYGLDRINQRSLPLDGYAGQTTTGKGVSIYVIDSGVDISHPEIAGRAYYGYDFVDRDANADDCDGHGTHVAGTAAGRTVGVAPSANIVSVRVLNCSGSGRGSDSISAFEWVAKNAKKPAVINFSVGWKNGRWAPIENTINKVVNFHGIQASVSAGNSNANACKFSPAAASSPIRVGSSDRYDYRSNFSNFGSCIDIFAPGSGIYSAQNGGGYIYMSGTSMAAPHVAGAAALYLEKFPHASSEQVKNTLISFASVNKLNNLGTGSPNRLLYTGFIPPEPFKEVWLIPIINYLIL